MRGMNTRPSQNTSVWDLRMAAVRLLLVAGCAFLISARAGAAEALAYSVILTGACQFQMIMGWDNCQNKATFTMFKVASTYSNLLIKIRTAINLLE